VIEKNRITRCFMVLFSAERLAVAPAKWKLEFKKDVIAGCHERLVRCWLMFLNSPDGR
jgi:hypothetical protein